jgi:hypothetical protein
MDFASLRTSNARYALVLSLLSGLSFFQHASFASAAVDADDALGLCQIETLPKDIRATLERRFYGWKVQDSTNLLPRARQKWAAIAPLGCPGIAAGHYQDSRSVSYALLLVPLDRSANGYKFVVFSAPFFIHAVAVDRVFDGDLRKKFRPKGSDGILLAFVDDKTPTQNVFFWTGESYDHAQVDF